MGYNTVIMFSNDASSQYKQHQEQVCQNIHVALCNTNEKSMSYSVGNHCNPMQSLKSVHADTSQLIMNYGNSLIEFGSNNDIEDNLIEVREKFLREAKMIIKMEEKIIARIKGKIEIDTMDLFYVHSQPLKHGKYSIIREKQKTHEDPLVYIVFENNNVVFRGNKKEVLEFSNLQVKKRIKKVKEKTKSNN